MFFYHSLYSQLALPERHRFPIEKYQLLQEHLIKTGLEPYIQRPDKATVDQISLCHDTHYIKEFLNAELEPKAIKKIGFPWSELLVERTLYSIGASISAARYALKHQFSINLSGGYHHAHSDHGTGFCIFNDLAIAAAELIHAELVDTVVILDCDVHQGDGTAEIAQNNPSMITCSIHCEQNFPRVKMQSDYDFALPSGTQDNEYLSTVSQALSLIYRLHNPDIILYNAGADIASSDELGHFDISLKGVYERDSLVLNFAREHKIPLAVGLGGGYQRNINTLVNVHKQLFNAVVDHKIIMV